MKDTVNNALVIINVTNVQGYYTISMDNAFRYKDSENHLTTDEIFHQFRNMKNITQLKLVFRKDSVNLVRI